VELIKSATMLGEKQYTMEEVESGELWVITTNHSPL